ncbi:MAG: ATP-dependent RecD-like DNA helicase [Synergistaceae bacterium]|jgi:exodeoxyribonuclease V alpha subunit|nr:ATP-dependent RecD-like DNA helicase [Synergistaceae bacterium]
MPETAEILNGQLERITYANEESGYSVFKIAVRDNPDLVTAVGYSAGHMPGEELEFSGEWTVHPKFGPQFLFSSCKSLLPATAEGIKRYLGSGLIKGVGPKMAERIVGEFGERTLDVLDESPDDLLDIKGISQKLLDSIKQCWEMQKEVRSVMIFLQSNGVSPNFAAKIFAEYGQETIQVVKENPYRLASDIFGIGFLSADKVAMNMGAELSSPMRLDAGVQYVMSELTGEGHVYAPREVLAARAAELLGVGQEMTDGAISRSSAEMLLAAENILPDGADGPVEAIYLPAYYVAESKSASMLARIAKRDAVTELNDLVNETAAIDTESAVAWVRDSMGIDLAENQAEALTMALGSKALIITGGPGTGKTTLIRAITGILEARGLRILMAAPTGRAAKRMSEATGHDARTIHRMLEFNGRTGFARTPDNNLNCDLLIVDEASMIDVLLLFHLLRAVPEEAKLILVGDIHQLPSVGPGNVLKDLIASGAIPVAELNEIFRQAKESSIIVNAHRVNSGLTPVEPSGNGLHDFYFVQLEEPEKCVEMILTLVRERIPARFGLNPATDIQVLTPMHKGTLGASNLNSVLQRELNPGGGAAIERGGRVFRTGDKVMQIRNNYDKDVYNGDIGFINRVDPEAGLITVDIDGRPIQYEAMDFDELVHAYAVSIHKSQGSEYPAVVIPLHTQHYVLLQRNLLYTGITRGRELVVIVGTKRAVAIAVKNDDTRRRYTYLGERLRKIAGAGG